MMINFLINISTTVTYINTLVSVFSSTQQYVDNFHLEIINGFLVNEGAIIPYMIKVGS
ncbi:hypothetical protein [Pedobacter frigiditerrae]|uniref:hypothetical protein n=1 Tax=Pedobacter frigiditerrae TaxID=2530452 RepID=UPI0013F16D7A|nr:hypothetical protein [Pedobacter frigiditerrae]